MTISEALIDKLRKHKNISDLAAKSGLSRTAIYNIMAGKASPSLATTEKLLAALGEK